MQGIGHAIVVGNKTEFAVRIFIITLGDNAHGLLDHLLHAVGIKVTDDDHSLSLGTVPAVVERDELVTCEVADDAHVTDGDAIGITAARQQDGQRVLVQAHLLVGMHAPFLLNHAAFLLDGTVVEVEVTCQLLQHQQHSVKQGNTIGGDI